MTFEQEACGVGLHDFTPWQDKGEQQHRQCRRCPARETRPYQRAQRLPYDPYAELME